MQPPIETGGNPPYQNLRDEHRRHPRHLVYWPVTIFTSHFPDAAAILHGETCELSMGGVSILSEQDFSLTSPVIVQLIVPAQAQGEPETLIKLQCSMIYTYLDGRHNRFRLGFCFDAISDEAKISLYDVLSKRIPAPY